MLQIQDISKRWEDENREYLSACKGKKIVVMYSGGKDSSVAMYLLRRVMKSWDFSIEAYLYAYPIHRYDDDFKKRVVDYWKEKGITINYHTANEDDSLLEENNNPCRVCQNIRKKQLLTLFEMLKTSIKNVVLVSGHSLWDLAGYAVNRLVASELAVKSNLGEAATEERFMEVAQRFYPFLKMPEGYSVYRPMLFLNKDEIDAMVRNIGMPLLEIPCKYSQLRPKKVLGYYFEKFGYSFTFKSVFEFAKKRLNIPDIQHFQKITHEEFLSKKI